jgi:hypothetical protein
MSWLVKGLRTRGRMSGPTPFVGGWAQTKPLDSVLRDPLHGEFLALFGAVEKIKVGLLLIRNACLDPRGP